MVFHVTRIWLQLSLYLVLWHEELNLSWNFLSITSFYSKRHFIGQSVVLVESLANLLYVVSPVRVPVFLQPDSGRVFGYPGRFLSGILYMCHR
jgi:hypothetical protein